MSWKRVLAAALVAGFGWGWHAARAEEPAPKPKDEAAPKPAETPKPKEPYFGKHFAMYLETRGGPAQIKTVKTPLNSGSTMDSTSELDFSGNKNGQATIGWTLPRGRGQYLLAYNGIADGEFELHATGTQQNVPWWHIDIQNGNLHTTQTPPPPTPPLDLTTTVPKDLGNRIQTFDLLYRREYGGLKIRCRWAAGLRYLDYKGAVVVPTWLVGRIDLPGFGYSDGVQNPMLVMQQSTKGWGPTGSGEIDFNFFRQRLTLYAMIEAALLTETLSTDSGTFTYLAVDPSTTPPTYYPGPGQIGDDVKKSAWNNKFEGGIRVKLLEGFHLILDWNRTGYLDTVLLPEDLSIPQNASQTALGTTARFISRDFVVDTATVGLSFQF